MKRKLGYRVVPVLEPNGIVRRRQVRSDKLGKDYGRVSTNAHGRLVWVKKSSEVRAIEVVHGGARLRRIRLVARDRGGSLGARKSHGERRGLNPEANLTVVLPEGRIREFKEAVAEAIQEEAPFPLELSWHVASNDPAPGAFVGIEEAAVYTYGRSTPQEGFTRAFRSIAEGELPRAGRTEVKPATGEAERILRAVQRQDASGRAYWVDPVSGRRTFNPSAVR